MKWIVQWFFASCEDDGSQALGIHRTKVACRWSLRNEMGLSMRRDEKFKCSRKEGESALSVMGGGSVGEAEATVREERPTSIY